MKEGETLFVMVTKVNKGGLIANVEGIPGFLPVSQLKPEHYPKVEKGDPEKILQELQNFIGKELEVAILSLNPEENNLILSEKEANTEKMQEILQQYKEGDTVQGKITGVVDFGAFLKFPYSEKKEEGGAIEGLIHISELDWQLIENPHDVISEGDVVKAQIIEISQGRVSLSLKALKKDPWNKIEEKYQKGNIVEGKVSKFNSFGAFIKISSKVQGLIHISEFGTEVKMKEALQVEKKYKFEISLLDPKEHRMILKLVS